MKNILITGAAGGIGKEISKKFILEGYRVYSIDLDTLDLGDNFINLIGDVTSLSSLKEIKEKIKDIKFNHIITLAGRALEDEWKPVSDISLETIHDSINLNLVGQLNVISLFLDQLIDSVTLVSSINAYGGFGLPFYSAAKAGLIGYMNTVKDEFKENHHRINVIAPGTIVTEATLKEPKDFSELLKMTDHGRFATAEEVGELAYSICELSSRHGEVIIIDEGQLKHKSK